MTHNELHDLILKLTGLFDEPVSELHLAVGEFAQARTADGRTLTSKTICR